MIQMGVDGEKEEGVSLAAFPSRFGRVMIGRTTSTLGHEDRLCQTTTQKNRMHTSRMGAGIRRLGKNLSLRGGSFCVRSRFVFERLLLALGNWRAERGGIAINVA
jgi:hypothetical protein